MLYFYFFHVASLAPLVMRSLDGHSTEPHMHITWKLEKCFEMAAMHVRNS